jgi:GNAT superfamily N-acetyltransferase
VTLEYEVVDWSAATLELDESFAYAGKFRVPSGKAVARDGDEIIAALSFSPDRADDSAVRIRYFAVRTDRRGEGIGSTLLEHVTDRLLDERGYATVRISVNNPYAFEAAHKAGFGWTGDTAGLAELVMERPLSDAVDREEMYFEALRRFAGRDLTDEEDEFVRRKLHD